MLYSTIVDKNEEGLKMVLEAAGKFEQDKYLSAIYNRHFRKEDILGFTEYVREYRSRLGREHLALARFALTFNTEYATDNNKCFDTAEQIFRKIRSTISSSKKIYKRFCRTDRSRRPTTVVSQHPSVFKHSDLVNDYQTGMLFGVETYEECVQTLYDELEAFFVELVKCLALCRMIIMEESVIRHTPERCMDIYRECYNKALNNSHIMVRLFKENRTVPSSVMEERKKRAGTMSEFICSNYHVYDPSQFQLYVVVSELNKGEEMTDDEKFLFGPDNRVLAEKARLVIEHFDELEQNAHKGKHKDKHSSFCVASFMLWCGIGVNPDDKVTLFVEDYFNKTYQGIYPAVKTNAVNTAKNILLHKPHESSLDNAAFHAKIEALIAKYATDDKILLSQAANF